MKHHRLKSLGLLCGLLFFLTVACAEEIEKSQAVTDTLWEKAQDMAGSAWQSTRQWFAGNHQEDDSFERLWKGLVPKLDQTLTLEDRQEKLPESVWFGEDQISNQEEINQLLDEASTLLSLSPAQHYRERIRALQENIRQAREEITEYRTRRIAAPKDSLWQKTVDGYDAAIQERQARIEANLNELNTVKRRFADELQSLGLQLSDEQLDFLLSTVVGDDLIEMGIAFDNVKAITLQLEQLMVDSHEDLQSGRRYYGMYMILLKVLERMQVHLSDAINERYVPEIDSIIQKTRALMAQTRELQKRASASQSILAANLEAQQLTLRAANFYRDYLVEQSKEVESARRRLKQDIAIAENTYETVKVSGELVALMRTSQRLLDDFLKRQVPPLRPFQNLEMKREFEKLTAQLRQSGAT